MCICLWMKRKLVRGVKSLFYVVFLYVELDLCLQIRFALLNTMICLSCACVAILSLAYIHRFVFFLACSLPTTQCIQKDRLCHHRLHYHVKIARHESNDDYHWLPYILWDSKICACSTDHRVHTPNTV